ncbi:mycofactocin biosynthesis glycosyltransferase MftF [Kitasatospora sp. NPDC006697]|uniref:mycofactocin biosynthesis glycosyltransferase MftF n=1 Tax=Kitasatospora sp. NPDC006697 TaxID=3364020 RepID=UPI0036C5ED68
MTDELPLPAAFRLRADDNLTVHQDGRVLLGGAPYRLVRLAGPAAALVGEWLAGKPVGDGRAAGLLARRLVRAGLLHPVPPLDGPRPAVTVVVPVRDRAGELARCLAGLPGGVAVIVVDDASADPEAVAEVVRAAGARLVRRPVNGGPAAARNTGLAHAGTDLVAFLDSDCVPGPDWIEGLLPHFADPAVAVAAPRITADRPGQGLFARYENEHSALDMGPRESIVRPGAVVSYLPSAALLVRRAAVGAGFDESIRVGEDVDLVWRLAADGHHVRYDPSVTVGHQHRTRPRQWLAQRIQYGGSAGPLAVRHPDKLPAVAVPAASAAAWALLVARRPVAAAALTAGTTALVAHRLSEWSDRPWQQAALIGTGSTLRTVEVLGRTVTRAWWPLAVPLAAAVPRLRLPLAAAAVLPTVLAHRRTRPALPLLPWAAVRLTDDVAFSLGLWRSCLRERTTRPIRTRLWWHSRDGVTPSGGWGR